MHRPWLATEETFRAVRPEGPFTHLRAYRRRATEHAVVIGEPVDQDASLLDLLPMVWADLSAAGRDEVTRVYSYCPAAAEPFRLHDSDRDVAGRSIEIPVTDARSKGAGAVLACVLGDGPVVDMWPLEQYTVDALRGRLLRHPVGSEAVRCSVCEAGCRGS